MLRSLFSGVSGLRSHQLMMDVVGNNIANVNTTGYKGSSALFQDLLSQNLNGAGAPGGLQGGTNPAQVGLGTRLAGIQQNFAQGALQVTGRSTDIAIQGDGFFIVNQGGQQVYTRAGNFMFDGAGNLVNPQGAIVQGWMATPGSDTVNNTGPIGNLNMPPGTLLNPSQTENVRLGGKLSAGAAVGATISDSINVFDSQGTAQVLTVTWTKTAANAWSAEAFDGTNTSLGTTAITFDPATGLMDSQTPDPWTVTPTTPAANWPNAITLSFGDPATQTDALKEFGGVSSAGIKSQDGSEAGTLQSFSISNNGVVTGVFSNGKTQTVGQVALANFNNPGGLEKAGDSLWRVTPNSGDPQVGVAGSNGRGGLAAGTLEMSNVDLGAEFTNLIIAQRGFQANSKVITSSDELLQDLLNMKR